MNECKCGCGEKASSGRDFRPGHDSKLRSKIEAEIGGILPLEKLVDAAKEYSCEKMSDIDFLKVVRKIFTEKNKKIP